MDLHEIFNGQHPCEHVDCPHIVEYDDEPYCFTHSPDEGSAVPGYSYKRTHQEAPMNEEERQIGTIEILRQRVYALDADSPHPWTQVVVEPGEYRVMTNGFSVWFDLHGRISGRGVRRMGDGLLAGQRSDSTDGPEVRFPSKVFGPDEWIEFLASDPTIVEGPQRRLRFTPAVPA